MAQRLKPELRQRILDSALEAFTQHDYHAVSMRQIAAMSNMTVGNLYHYFKDKDEIFQLVVQDAMNALNQTIHNPLTRDEYFYTLDKNSRQEYLKEQLNQFIASLLSIHQHYHYEFLILLRNPHIHDEITRLFSALIHQIIRHWTLKVDVSPEHHVLLSEMIAESIFAGMVHLFMKGEQDSIPLLLHQYLELYFQMIHRRQQ